MDTIFKNWWLLLINGILFLILGFSSLVHPIAALVSIAVYIGAVALVSGIMSLVLAFSNMRRQGWGWRFFEGVIDIVFGLLMLANPLRLGRDHPRTHRHLGIRPRADLHRRLVLVASPRLEHLGALSAGRHSAAGAGFPDDARRKVRIAAGGLSGDVRLPVHRIRKHLSGARPASDRQEARIKTGRRTPREECRFLFADETGM